MDLLTLRAEHVQGWVSDLLDAGQAVATVRTKAAAVRALTRGMQRDGLIEADPCTWLTLPRPARRSRRTWYDAPQLETLLSAARDAAPGVCAAVHLWALAGVRPPEPLHVQVRDLGTVGEQPSVYLPLRKGGDSDRIVLAPQVGDVLREAVGHRRAGPVILDHRTGEAYDLPALRYQLTRLTRAAGLPPVAPYGLRTGFIILCLEAGIPERDVAAYVGHSTTATLAHYDQMRATVSVRRSAGVLLARRLGETAAPVGSGGE